MRRVLYVFLDESGNLDFSNNGSEYFINTALSIERPFKGFDEMVELR